jgi:hypothetical protein
MKTAAWLVLFLAFGLLGFWAWRQHVDIREAEARAAVLVAQQDSALAEAALAEARADSVALVLDSLEAVRAEEKAAAARRAALLRARADSLQQAIGDMLPPDVVDVEVAEAVMYAVTEIREGYETQLTDLANVLISTELSLDTAMEQAWEWEQVNANLRAAFRSLEEERDMWRAVGQPNLLARLKRDAPGMAIAAGLGYLIGR